jgi:hypothetical protein
MPDPDYDLIQGFSPHLVGAGLRPARHLIGQVSNPPPLAVSPLVTLPGGEFAEGTPLPLQSTGAPRFAGAGLRPARQG